MSRRNTRQTMTTHKPLVVNDIEVGDVTDEENIFESLDFQNVHTAFQKSYLELIQNIDNKEVKKGSEGIVRIDLKRDSLLFETYKKAQSNYGKVLKKVEDHEKDFKIKCFARMRKLILAVLYADKKFGKRVTRFDGDKLVEIGALDAIPVCPRGGEYSIIYKNGRRLFNCSIHGVLKN
ncbi:MAG: hypothetical protein IKO19_05155 [Candidatus Riflebacteria bacterium]|nr:hypothetical protein [Candidatus Riflebacteria bacterium]